MQYMLLIYGNEEVDAKRSPAEQEGLMKAYYAFGDAVRARNAMVAGEALHPVATATTVRVRDGKMLTTDGPFAETKEQLGGFYIVDARDLDEAIELAAKIPGAASGCVEVRPVVDFGERPADS